MVMNYRADVLCIRHRPLPNVTSCNTWKYRLINSLTPPSSTSTSTTHRPPPPSPMSVHQHQILHVKKQTTFFLQTVEEQQHLSVLV
ncbi:hypothetical protein Hanom_Chr14g01266781 [Helianthus anomalus]